MDDQLTPVEPAEVGADDEKILKKRGKKTGQSPEQLELERKQEKNWKAAQFLIGEFDKKLKSLGFTLQPILRYLPTSVKPGNELRALSLEEMKRIEAMKELEDAKEKLRKDPPAEPVEPGRTEPAVPEEPAVEPLNVPE